MSLLLKYASVPAKRIIIIGMGVAGSEVGTYLGHQTTQRLDIVQIESEPTRRFGGWAFQSFPGTNTNLALRKMYLGRDPKEILNWINDPEQRLTWPEALRERIYSPDRPMPRELFQHYVTWRRNQVNNPLVSYHSVIAEAMRVQLIGNEQVSVSLSTGKCITADQLIMASGSSLVKTPSYLQSLQTNEKIIIDPLTREGHERRQSIPLGARVLILGTGLTGEEQAELLYRRGHRSLTLFSRGGRRHFTYPEDQTNLPLNLDTPPEFLLADSTEELEYKMTEFFQHYTSKGHSHEDIIASIRPHWDTMRHQLGGCFSAANILHRFRRPLAINSIGTSFEVAMKLKQAEDEGALKIQHGHIESITQAVNGAFTVRYLESKDKADSLHEFTVDFIINAVGRSIIQHPIWAGLLKDGLASHHAGIGVRVSDTGQLLDINGKPSARIRVVGMARAGDHTLRHGFLGNTAFNVPQVRAHVYDTVDALLGVPRPQHKTRFEEVSYLVSHGGLNARLSGTDETPLIWAVSQGYESITLSLIEAGVDLNAYNNRGNTALIRAVCEGRAKLAQALIHAGASVDIQNEDGYTALILAKRRGYDFIANSLLKAGANTGLKSQTGYTFDNPGYVPRVPLSDAINPAMETRLIQQIRATVKKKVLPKLGRLGK